MDTTIDEKPTRPPTSSATTRHGLPSGATLTDQPEVDLQCGGTKQASRAEGKAGPHAPGHHPHDIEAQRDKKNVGNMPFPLAELLLLWYL